MRPTGWLFVGAFAGTCVSAAGFFAHLGVGGALILLAVLVALGGIAVLLAPWSQSRIPDPRRR